MSVRRFFYDPYWGSRYNVFLGIWELILRNSDGLGGELKGWGPKEGGKQGVPQRSAYPV